MQWYWWALLITCGYFVLFILIAKLTSKRGLRISVAATICAQILYLPFTDPPSSHVISLVAVFNLLALVWPLLVREAPPKPVTVE
ncbi:hypothetical protein BEL07_19040 [Mycolicibacterium grossiae]|uniref:Uncharacterized protein n=1 Tax=Mycolicibacterium grossiae TaxID=1552759 RepID=A0A1E8Q0W8_9MYCO|nr:hypothetical protein [Mycolicibacterium grossiae]OFJ52175.1 hypothetical protein BEL07_19040 [Mycolicibacterium grossiae]